VRTTSHSAQSALAPQWLIDDAGRLFDSQSATLRHALNAWHTGDAFADYTVRNMGFIGVGWVGTPARAALHVQLRPSHVTPAAVTGLVRWLQQHRARRVMLTWFDGGTWQSEVLGDGATARLKLSALAQLPAPDADDLQAA
jgi:hypothetical protein